MPTTTMTSAINLSILLLSMVSAARADSLHAYYSYRSATCLDSETISGTAVMSYDDADMTALMGVQIDNYEGPCLYFPECGMPQMCTA